MNKKVMLVYPRTKDMWSTMAPLGIMYLSSYLKDHEISTRIIDLMFISLEEYEKELRGFSPDFIGFSIQTPLIETTLKMIEIAKRVSPESKIIVGGSHATISPETLSNNRDIDFVVMGEGEKTLLDIVNGKIKRGLIRGKPIESLDELPFPDRDNYDRYIEINHGVEIMVSRGCPYNCMFCQPTQRKLFGNKMKTRTPENVIREIESIIDRFGKNFIIFFFDDTFTWNREWLLEFCSLVKPLKVGWNCNSRVNLVDYGLLKRMKEAGCIAITYGVESCSQKILNFIRKGTTVEQIGNALRLTHKAGILAYADLIIGTPTETEEDLEKTVEFVKKFHPDGIQVSIMTPLVGTDLERYCKEKNILNIKSSSDYLYLMDDKYPIKLEHLTREDLRFYKKKLFDAYHSVKHKNYLKYLKLFFARRRVFVLYLKIYLKSELRKR